jgi:hypothetical protein
MKSKIFQKSQKKAKKSQNHPKFGFLSNLGVFGKILLFGKFCIFYIFHTHTHILCTKKPFFAKNR